LHIFHGLGIGGADAGASFQQIADYVEGGGFADVVGVCFESQAPDGDGCAVDGTAELGDQLLDEAFFLGFVDGLNGVDEQIFVANGAGDVFQRSHILGEAASAVAAASAEEGGADAIVGADAFANVFDVSAVGFTENGHP